MAITTMSANETCRAASAWEVIPIARTAWRICDRSVTEFEASRLIAYVHRNDTGTVDVLWLRSPCPTRSRYRDLDELLADLDTAVASRSACRADPPNRIPHLPPHRSWCAEGNAEHPHRNYPEGGIILTKPDIHNWWPRLSADGKRALDDQRGESIPDTVRQEVEALTGTPMAGDAKLTAQDRDFIRTQHEAVD